MSRLDLEVPRFSQAQVLDIVPALSAKALQNWIERGVFRPAKRPRNVAGKRRRGDRGEARRYTPMGVIALAFMARVTDLGIGPSAAFEMVEQIATHVLKVHAKYPAKEENGRLVWIIAAGEHELYHRGYIVKHKGVHTILIHRGDLGIQRTGFLPDVYITVEIDLMILATLERIYALLAGQKLSDGVTIKGPAEGIEIIAKIAQFASEFSRPGGKK